MGSEGSKDIASFRAGLYLVKAVNKTTDADVSDQKNVKSDKGQLAIGTLSCRAFLDGKIDKGVNILLP